MTRLRYDGLSTTLGADLTGTTVTFAAALTYRGGTAVPTIGTGDYIPLSIMSPSGRLAEIVYLTGYTSGATTGTVTRAQEGTPNATRAATSRVIHGPTVTDLVGVETGRLVGNGSPEGVVSAPTSTEYVDRNATNGAIRWVKSYGDGSVGWVVSHGHLRRNIAASITTNAQLTAVYQAFVERADRTVTVDFQFDLTNPQPPLLITTLPEGLQPYGYYYGSSTRGVKFLFNTAGQLFYYGELSGIDEIHFAYIDRLGTWPSPLPGTPA